MGAWGQAAPVPGGLVFRFTFDGELARDSSGQGVAAEVTGPAQRVAGREGSALGLDGSGGLAVRPGPGLELGGGFAVELWVRFDDVSRSQALVVREGEFILRVDPEQEGGRISFFVYADGSYEPRLMGPRPRIGEWSHLVATWDGRELGLWVDGRLDRAWRSGALAATANPVVVGVPGPHSATGLIGALDEVRLYDRALTEGDILLAEYGLQVAPEGVRSSSLELLDAAAGAGGWEGLDGTPVAEGRAGALESVSAWGGTGLVHRRLEAPLDEAEFCVVRLAVDRGASVRLLFATCEGVAGVVPLASAGGDVLRQHVLDLRTCREWRGRLALLALIPADPGARLRVSHLRLAARQDTPPALGVRWFLPEIGVERAQRPARVLATIENRGGAARDLRVRLLAPPAVAVLSANPVPVAALAGGATADLAWDVRSETAGSVRLGLEVSGPRSEPAVAELTVTFTPPVGRTTAAYVPEPAPVPCELLVGVQNCPLWNRRHAQTMWDNVARDPRRMPVLGTYEEEHPEVKDWETRFLVEHGISFVVYCWYRRGEGRPVTPETLAFGEAIHEGLLRSRYVDRVRFAIMWTNERSGLSGVASEADLLENVVPFWIEHYFRHPSYLRVDNRPVLAVFLPDRLADDLGGVAPAAAALRAVRERVRAAGFDGLLLWGQCYSLARAAHERMRDMGFDYTFSYHWFVRDSPSPAQAIAAQEAYWRGVQELQVLPQVVSASMGWTGWGDEGTVWKLPPADYALLLRKAREFVRALPAGQLGSRMLLLDNWNEWGEGHYIAPHREFGFGHLDAVRDVLSAAPGPHLDLMPQDVGRGPYDGAYRRVLELRRAAAAVRGSGSGEDGLVAWWGFDEADGTPVAYDGSGNGLGGVLDANSPATLDAIGQPLLGPGVAGAGLGRSDDGVVGRALVCAGGSVLVGYDPRLWPERDLTVEGWLRPARAGQTGAWFVWALGAGAEAGYRFGLEDGRLSFALPRAGWGLFACLAAEPLPAERWVHVAATYDGACVRLWQDGREVGRTERRGPVLPVERGALCIGSVTRHHPGHYAGRLDELRLYRRALTPDELARRQRP
jgi:hypothetical protein